MRDLKFLMGATKDKSLVFAEVRFYEQDKHVLSISFNEVSPFVASEEYLQMMFDSKMECYGYDDLYTLCNEFDCKPSELRDVKYASDMMNMGVEAFVDISLYPEFYTVKSQDDDIYFESVGCGQHDTRDKLIPINKELCDLIFDAWDNFHLETISEELKLMLIDVINLASIDETVWIQNWLETVVYPE